MPLSQLIRRYDMIGIAKEWFNIKGLRATLEEIAETLKGYEEMTDFMTVLKKSNVYSEGYPVVF